MEILGNLLDHRIQAINVLVQVTMKEYLEIAKVILNENEFQRKKVINGQISKQLSADIIVGCSVPPLVLAVQKDVIGTEFNYQEKHDVDEIIHKSFGEKKLLILDGKQRTHVFIKLYEELNKDLENPEKDRAYIQKQLDSFLSNVLRIEVYLGINKLNILYRMLTLNSGQTNMSTRHLMEMLYLDYLNIPFKGIKLIADKDDQTVSKDPSEFVFKDVLDGFTSYLDKDENTLERSEILDNIKSAKNIIQEENDKNIFEEFVIVYKSVVDRMITLSAGFTFDSERIAGSEYAIKSSPFGKTAAEVFKRSQAISGFGAAIAELKDIRKDFDLSKVLTLIPNFRFHDDDFERTILLLLKHFDTIRDKSKKIGIDQRFYFRVFFKHLFDPESSYPLSLDKSVEYAYKKLREEKSYLKDLNS